VILDMHAVPGWQDPDWHSDNPTRVVMLWRHPYFHERLAALWKEFARRYRGNPTIAGYNIINEPVTDAPFGSYGFKFRPDWDAQNRVNKLLVSSIRRVDKEHIIFIEGDDFSTLFSGLDAPFDDDLVYSNHIYLRPCLSNGKYPGEFTGERWDQRTIEQRYLKHEGTVFAKRHRVPLWVGEFGGAFDGPKDEVKYRLKAVEDEIAVFEKYRAHWTIWTYKDVGMMGTVVVDPASKYLRAIAPLMKAKRATSTDSWASNAPMTEIKSMVYELGERILKEIPGSGVDPANCKRHLANMILGGYAGRLLQPLYANCFKGMTKQEIDRTMRSFALENCRVNQGLYRMIKRYMR
jgi:hypothetical protein